MLCEISTTPRPLSVSSAHELEHLRGLRDAEGGGGLVEDDDAAVPEHGLGDGDGLSLAAGEAGDELPE
nr:hypothetical protein GCM10020092_078000 [Actinoplanes digitatis]